MVNFLEGATNSSKSTVANQATPGMCMKHFSIGTDAMLGADRKNPVEIELPENKMVSFALPFQIN